RHAAGYAVVQPEGAAPGGMIVPKGRGLLPSPSFEKFDTLYGVFAEIRDPEALLDFVSKFGLLMGRGDDLSPWGDSIEEVLREAAITERGTRGPDQGGDRRIADLRLPARSRHPQAPGAGRGSEAPNHKRVYRVMKVHGLLLDRHAGGAVRRHDGRIAVD